MCTKFYENISKGDTKKITKGHYSLKYSCTVTVLVTCTLPDNIQLFHVFVGKSHMYRLEVL